MKRFLPIFTVLTFLLSSARADDRPNFILFITDDISAEDLGCYGDPIARTPHLEQLAADGIRFTNAYLTISSCSPSRCSLITGRYPHNTGAAELHTRLPEGHYLWPEALKNAGYHTALSGKHHMGKNADPAFVEISNGKGPGREEDWVPMLRNRPKDKPFFFWFASMDAHRSWQKDDTAPVYEPEKIKVPPYLVDGPLTRQDLADYYHEVSRTDHYTGELRAELKRQGIEGNTYIIYMSDNGRPFPRCKTRLYDSGIKTPLIISCPGKIEPAVSESLVSANIDLGPTILELAGLEIDERLQGVSMNPLFENPDAAIRNFAFAEHNWHVHQAHERMVRHGDWLYIRNAWPERQLMCVEAAPKFPAGEELWAGHANGTLDKNQRDIFQVSRAPEELFHVGEDPHQLTNVAATEENADVLDQMRKVLDRWTSETGDTIPEDPTNDREDPYGKKFKNHKRGTMPGDETNAVKINAKGPVL